MAKTIDINHAKANQQNTQTNHQLGVLRPIGRFSLTLLLIIVVFISTLPVVLLFFTTAVPTIIAIGLVLADAGILLGLFFLSRTPLTVLGVCAGLMLVSLLAVIASQRFASTPPITDASGNVIPGSIATLEAVELGGEIQWITVRGRSADNPVLLFLAGGPGGSELVMTRRYLNALEEHFIVVNWDQPGTGKSYRAVDFDALTPQRYVDDAFMLTCYLRERFDQDKIYVFGESWGSILGIWLVQQYPDLFHAFVSTGQMVDIIENDTIMYEFAINLLTEQGRTEDVERLRLIGAPPYASNELIRGFGASNNVLNAYMAAHAHGEGTGQNLMLDSLGAQEYGLQDKVYWLLGLRDVFTTVYPQLYDLDFRIQAPRLEIPIYFIKGRWDVNAVNSLTEEYFALLEAPHKELIWFEDSAHTPSWEEPANFVDVMVNTVLAQTYPPAPDRNTHSD